MLDHVRDRAVAQGLDALDCEAVPTVPGDEVAERRARIEPDDFATKLARPLFGGGKQRSADTGTLRGGIGGDAPYQEIIGARLEDQGADEPGVLFRHPDLHVAHDDCIVGEQGQRLDTEEGAVFRISRPLQSEQGCQIASLRPPQG